MATISEPLAIAVQHHQAGRLQAAEQIYRRILAVEPNHAEAHCNLGVLFKAQGKLEEAIASYRRAVELKPDSAELHSNLGNALKDQFKLDEAVACCRRAVELRPDLAEGHGNLGNALKDQGNLDEAVACYRRALEWKPDFAEARCNLGGALEAMGDLQGAEDSLRAALRHNPRFTFAHYKLAEILRGRLPDEDLAAQRQLLEDARLPDAQRLFLHFGLAQALDARSRYDEAAEHLDRGNALQLADWRRRGQEYDPQKFELLVARMIAACSPEFFSRVRDLGLTSEVPVFVFGLPRSGTTLIEQILAGHSRVFGAGELKLAGETMAAICGPSTESIEGLRDLDREAVQRHASRHFERLQALNRTARRIVDKMPDNYLFLGLLAALFPRAKFIHCRRDLRDVAVSCWMTHFREIQWTNDRRHIASRVFEYQRIMDHWRATLPVPLLEIDYEETVADLEEVARKLIAWCGLEWEPGCLCFHQTKRPVRTVSASQVRQPVYGTSVGRWKHYEKPLESLFAQLEIKSQRT